MSDGLPRSIGVEGTGPTGPGRVGPNHTQRNAPTLWNAAYREQLFDDGRADSLESQVHSPLTNAVEMNRDPAQLVVDLSAIPKYVELFQAAFPREAAPVSYVDVTRALGAFERTLVTRRANYDRYAAGDTGGLNAESIRGMNLFARGGLLELPRAPALRERALRESGHRRRQRPGPLRGDERAAGPRRIPRADVAQHPRDGAVLPRRLGGEARGRRGARGRAVARARARAGSSPPTRFRPSRCSSTRGSSIAPTIRRDPTRCRAGSRSLRTGSAFRAESVPFCHKTVAKWHTIWRLIDACHMIPA